MSSVSVSVAAVNPLTVLTPDAINSDGVTPSSESSFSGVLDASIPLDMPVDTTTEVTAKELPAELPETATSFSALAESAADILMTLQASREMDTSLQTNNLPAPANQLETANQSNEAVSADITDVTDIDPDVVVPASPLAEKPSAVNNHVETKQIPFPNKNQEPAVATKHSSAIANVKSDTVVVPGPELMTDDLSVSQPVSESVKNQTELSPDALSESDAPSQLEPLSESDLQEVAQAKATAQQNIAEAIDSASVIQTATADVVDTASPSNDKIQHAKADKKIKAAETSLPDPAVAVMLANMQPIADKPISPAESDADLISAMPEADDAADNVTNKTESSVKSASLGNMIHDFVGMLKNNDDPVSSSARVIANNLADGKDTSTTVDEASSEQDITASQSGDISPELTTTNTTAESVNNKSDNSTTFDAGVNKDTTAVNSLAHENHGVSVTGKSALSSTGNLPEQAQGLRNITEQLPSLYMKNGHVEEHELAARVMLMVGEKWQEAELQLEPQGMGKIRVQLSIDQEQQTNVQFMVQHSQAKEALDQSLPRLRELLTQHGLQPGQTQVQQQTQDNAGQAWNQQMANNSAAEQQTRRDSSQAGNAFSGSNDDEFAQTVTVSASDAAGIDFYA
jgi:flagellar hook-length control protein FliK